MSASSERSGPSHRARLPRLRWSKVLAVVLLVLSVPVMGVVVGWYGMNPRANEAYAPVGSDAHLLLNNFPDSRLVVELDAAPGYAPPASAVSTLLDRINETTSKSSVSVVSYTISTTSSSWTTSDLLALQASVRQSWPSWGTMTVCYLFVPGTFQEGSSAIGVAYRGSSIAVFPDVITANIPSYDPQLFPEMMTTVLVHEFGHELGLVGLVGSAPNEDPAHPGHSTDTNDVMYWQVESTSYLPGILSGPPPPTQFDSADLQDLQTVRSTVIPLEVLPYLWLLLVALVVVLVAAWGRWPRRKGRAAVSSPA
ncbi:MAG: hypothetical protein KGJ23_11795 [Euryarchaeota archaeon]|nr:hypothetical protein [Euryarchaeota archaeon]MDE1837278.1 hypothetical protein [Euryarchaeota archaeon]MDE1879948.1 hypothetical protein [Euryarchaeota archaeon]MDE2045118.1 hypothetical protein [Thermoplasmata archaeon]